MTVDRTKASPQLQKLMRAHDHMRATILFLLGIGVIVIFAMLVYSFANDTPWIWFFDTLLLSLMANSFYAMWHATTDRIIGPMVELEQAMRRHGFKGPFDG